MARHNETGALGEEVACRFLSKKGFVIVKRNYWRKWGEIDIIAQATNGVTHFIEVKSTLKDYTCNDKVDEWRPEEMLHTRKIHRLKRVIQTYILEHGTDEWIFDVVIVYINKRTRTARCKYIKDIVL